MIVWQILLGTVVFAGDLFLASQGRIGQGWHSDFVVPNECLVAIDFDERNKWSQCSSTLRSSKTLPELERDRTMWLVVSELREHDLNAAYRDFAPLLEFDSWQYDDWRVLILEAWLLNEMQQGQKLETLLQDFPVDHLDYSGALIVQLNALTLDGKLRKRDKLWQGIDAQSMSPWLWWHRGQLEKPENKGHYLKQAVEMNKADAAHYKAYAKYLLNLKEPQSSLQVLVQGLSQFPSSLSLTSLAIAISKETDALEWLKQQATVFPEHTKIQWLLGSVHLSKKEYDQAWPLFTRALWSGDDSPLLKVALRNVYPHVKTYPEIWTDVQQVVSYIPTSQYWVEQWYELCTTETQREHVYIHLEDISSDSADTNKQRWATDLLNQWRN